MSTVNSNVALLVVLFLSTVAMAVSRAFYHDAVAAYGISEWDWRLGDENAENIFRILGGTAMSRPCCTSIGNGIVHCFIRNAGSYVDVMSITKNGARKWTTLDDSRIIDGIECVSTGVDQLTLVALDENSAIITNRRRKEEWEGWKWRSGVLVEVPSCVARNGEINCVHRRFDNSGFRTDMIEGDWKWNYAIGGDFTSPIKCIAANAMQLDCFGAMAPKRVLQHRRYDAEEEEWVSDWETRGGYAIGRPSATSWGSDRIDVFYIGTNNTVKHIAYNGTWAAEETLDSNTHFDTSPECVATKVGRIHCFAIGRNSALYRNSMNGSTWSGWTLEFGTFLETPVCVAPVTGSDSVACYMRDYRLKLVEKYFEF